MYQGYDEIEEMDVLLQAESCGRPIDRERARLLAIRLAELCPDIGATMAQVADRMASRQMSRVA